MTRPARPVIELQAVSKIYGSEDTIVRAVDGVDLVVERGDYVAVMGASGSGKSTLMNIIGCLYAPTRGSYLLDGVDTRHLDAKRQATIRNRKIGFIFQSFNLLPTLTARENITLPADIAGRSPDPGWLDQIIDTVDLRPRLGHRPGELSGGQQQRVACARALAGRPSVIFADEPTGNLDSHSTSEVLGILRDLNARGRTLVIITHEDEVAQHARRIVRLRDGRIVSDERRSPPAVGPTGPTSLTGLTGLTGFAGFAGGFGPLRTASVSSFNFPRVDRFARSAFACVIASEVRVIMSASRICRSNICASPAAGVLTRGSILTVRGCSRVVPRAVRRTVYFPAGTHGPSGWLGVSR